MRHRLHTQVHIEAPPDAVWQVLTDLDRYCEWNPFIIEAQGDVAVGAKLRNRMCNPGGRAMTLRPRVTTVEPAQTFEWLGHLGVRGVFDARHRFELTATASGGTQVVHTEEFRGVLVRTMRKTLDTQTYAGFQAMNDALKDRTEAKTAVAT